MADAPVVVLVHRLGPYHVARFNAVYERLPELRVVQLSGRDETYAWDSPVAQAVFSHETLFHDSDVWTLPVDQVRAAVTDALERLSPRSLVVTGWFETASLAALDWALVHSLPIVVMTDSTYEDFRRISVVEFIKSALVAAFDAAFVSGERAREYARRLGIPAERIRLGYDCVDNNHFARGRGKPSSVDLPDKFFLFVGRFVKKKNLENLVLSHVDYVKSVNDPWSLVLAGAGEQEARLQEIITEQDAGIHIRFLPFQSYDTLPSLYAAASVTLLVSSSEQWGLVVNESMAAGTPVIVSEQCGCAPDLVQHGVTGWVCDGRNVASITQSLVVAGTATDESIQTMGKEARKKIELWGLDRFAGAFVDVISLAERERERRSTVCVRFLIGSVFRVRRLLGSRPGRRV